MSTVSVGGGGGALGGDGDDDGRGTRAKGVKGGGSARLSRQPGHSAPPAIGIGGWCRDFLQEELRCSSFFIEF